MKGGGWRRRIGVPLGRLGASKQQRPARGQAFVVSMKAGIEAAAAVDGVIKISAGNYGGKLGEYRINLRELIA